MLGTLVVLLAWYVVNAVAAELLERRAYRRMVNRAPGLVEAAAQHGGVR